jgi:hypothetical protein
LRGCGALCPLFLGICARVSGDSQSRPPRSIHRIQYANAAIEPARRCARSAAGARQASPMPRAAPFGFSSNATLVARLKRQDNLSSKKTSATRGTCKGSSLLQTHVRRA